MAPLVSFITINYNSSHHTIDLVNSIAQRTAPGCRYEIIVVDNASEAADYKALKEAMSKFPQVSVVRSRVNTGFSGGNMMGANYARGQYYFFINNDCVLLNDCATILKDFIDSRDGAAAATAEISDEQGKILSSNKLFPSVLKECLGNSAHRLFFPHTARGASAPAEAEVISGACMFFRADHFCEIGGFDTSFFLYCEEEDICKRVRDSGKTVHSVPMAKLMHKGRGSSSRSLALDKEYLISYNLLLDKHFGAASRIPLKAALLAKKLRQAFTREHGPELFIFAISGSPRRESLRYRQKVEAPAD